MRKIVLPVFIISIITFASLSFRAKDNPEVYLSHYRQKLNDFRNEELLLLDFIKTSDININAERVKSKINQARIKLKGVDFWFRYLLPIEYMKVNGPLPVEWEIEAFEKSERPRRRKGAGLTLASLYLDEHTITKDSLLQLIQSSIKAITVYNEEVVTNNLKTDPYFFLCNRLFLLNLSSVYTTGFENPDSARIIPELRSMLADVDSTYRAFNEGFETTPLTDEYLTLYKKAIEFVNSQPDNFSLFNHFVFLKDYINPLYALNQGLINKYNIIPESSVDYSLNKDCYSIFDKSLYRGQDAKGIFSKVSDEKALAEISRIGKLLFYDPILSGNNMRSCASCHKTANYFTDTLPAAIQYNHKDFLPRNTPSLINAGFNHLLMQDGTQATLVEQAKAVISNPQEMGSGPQEALEKVLSCDVYKTAFASFLKYTPWEPEITFEHIVSAITLYYSKFSNCYSPFDEAMNGNKKLDTNVQQGFNLFMSKARCGTCHYAPQFNGVKPPFLESEFEVLGVPGDTGFSKLSPDSGRYKINPADETLFAFRTGSVRNAEFTRPYMHNGVFTDLKQVIEFYNAGGGKGRGLQVNNQTLSPDSLHLSENEKNNLIAFIHSLNEKIEFEKPPQTLPSSTIKALNKRKAGGEY